MAFYETKFVFDEPIPYKKLKIYPARMRDYYNFHYFAQCLQLDKNSIPDAKIISMSYLEYIYYATEQDPEKTPYLFWLDRLLGVLLKDEDFSDMQKSMARYRYENKKPIIIIGETVYNSSDFDEIRQIICEQNLITLPDENIQKEIRDKMEEAERLRQKTNNSKIASLEDQIISVGIYTGWDLDKIYDLTVRKFGKVVQRSDNLLHYQIYLAASMSGMVEFKDKSFIKHWLSDLTQNKFESTMIESDALKEKLDKVSFSGKKS